MFGKLFRNYNYYWSFSLNHGNGEWLRNFFLQTQCGVPGLDGQPVLKLVQIFKPTLIRPEVASAITHPHFTAELHALDLLQPKLSGVLRFLSAHTKKAKGVVGLVNWGNHSASLKFPNFIIFLEPSWFVWNCRKNFDPLKFWPLLTLWN